jgi:hypothetical protein
MILEKIKEAIAEIELIEKQKKMLQDDIKGLIDVQGAEVFINMEFQIPNYDTDKVKVLDHDGSLTPEAKGEESNPQESFFFRFLYPGTQSEKPVTKVQKPKMQISIKDALVIYEILIKNMDARADYLQAYIKGIVK